MATETEYSIGIDGVIRAGGEAVARIIRDPKDRDAGEQHRIVIARRLVGQANATRELETEVRMLRAASPHLEFLRKVRRVQRHRAAAKRGRE